MSVSPKDYGKDQRFISLDGGYKLYPVADVYSYIYEAGMGKTVLRIKIAEDIFSFDELKKLLTEEGVVITSYVNVEKKVQTLDKTDFYVVTEAVEVATFENFCKDYTCKYEDGFYEVEITKKSATEITIDAIAEANMETAMALCTIYEEQL